MELKIKLKYLGIVLSLFLILIVVDWYKNIDYVSVYDQKIEESIPNGQLYLYSARYKLDNNKSYSFVSTNSIRKTKSAIPFIYEREILSSTKKELMLDPHQ